MLTCTRPVFATPNRTDDVPCRMTELPIFMKSTKSEPRPPRGLSSVAARRRQVGRHEHVRTIVRVTGQRDVGRIAEHKAELVRQELRMCRIDAARALLRLPEAITLDEDASRLSAPGRLREVVVQERDV